MTRTVLILLLGISPAVAQTGFVRDWLVLGSFPNRNAQSRLTEDYLAGEATVSPRGGEAVASTQWLLYHSPRDFVDFLWSDFEFGTRERCVVYAAFFVRSPERQPARLLVGSDDAIAVWCNGDQVHFADVVRGLVADNDTVAVNLRAGWNTILMKIANNEGGYGASARFSDGKGLVLGTQNPAPPQQAPTPPALHSRSGSLSFRYRLTERNTVAISVEIPVLNRGSGEARNIRLEYAAASRKLSSSSRPFIAGGELCKIVKDLTFADAIEIARSGAPLSVKLEHEGHDTTFSFVVAGDLLKNLFEPWELRGWQAQRLNDSTEKLSRSIVVPEDLSGLGLRFAVDIVDLWGSVSVNGTEVLPRFSGDSGELKLSSSTKAGEKFDIELKVKTRKPLGEKALYAASFRPRHDRIEQFLFDVRFAKEIYGFDAKGLPAVRARIFDLLHLRNLRALVAELQPFYQQVAPLVSEAKKLTLHMIGNAHIDMAWLWRYPETIEVTRATFRSALDNLRQYSDFRFSHGQAQSYYWIEQQYPEMFKEIREYVRQGRWEIVGGTWIESDGNMPSGESFARQYLYGKRYFKSRFGVDVKHGYHPDTFGHAATLPQILSKSGIETYTFFRPGDDERIFWWETPDGSRVLAHHPSNWYGTWSGIPDTLWTSAKKSGRTFAVTDVVQFFGVGDHGGGPTRRQIEQIEQLSKIQLYPKTQMSSFGALYAGMVPQVRNAPVQRGEQNFVFEGCYTSQAAIKSNNRKAEALLPTAEIFSVIAMQYGYAYPVKDLEIAWHMVLFNQFHDVLCGSGIHDVALDAETFYAEALEKGRNALDGALKVIGAQVGTSAKVKGAKALLVFNPLNWNRNESVEMTVSAKPAEEPRVLDARGIEVPSQIIERRGDSVKIVFTARGIPSVGYRTFWLATRKAQKQKSSSDLVLENRYFKLEIDAQSGCVARVYDKVRSREVVQPGRLLNEMQIQEDDAPMSAWVMGLRGEVHPIRDAASIKAVESGPVRKVVRSEYSYENSTFVQDVILYADRPVIDFRFSANWNHRKRALKIAFPLALSGSKATCDIPFGAAERPAEGREVVAQKWVDLSESEYGVTLLNDSKYGFDVKENVLRMTALRSPTDPDPKADEGRHEFRYALFLHNGGWREGGSVRKGYEFNTPVVSIETDQHAGRLSAAHSFLQITNPDVVLTALKKSEDDNALVLRAYESAGKVLQTDLKLWQPMTSVHETDLIEWNPRECSGKLNGSMTLSLEFKPTEIKTLKLNVGTIR
ncbi:MAG: Alpha-mann mid protein [Bacteroidetes bacterium]|nr:Alpha-mann mid protein [Bacteroidota bacterium]